MSEEIAPPLNEEGYNSISQSISSLEGTRAKLREKIFQDSDLSVSLGFGSAHLIFILVLICLMLLLSITVTLLCCLKGQFAGNEQENKTETAHENQNKQTQTLNNSVPQKVGNQFFLYNLI